MLRAKMLKILLQQYQRWPLPGIPHWRWLSGGEASIRRSIAGQAAIYEHMP